MREKIKKLSPAEQAEVIRFVLELAEKGSYRAIGQGLMRRSDLLFSIDKELRNHIDDYARRSTKGYKSNPKGIQFILSKNEDLECDLDEVKLYMSFRQDRVHFGEMYDLLCELECTLHNRIRLILMQEFGDGEGQWWRKGVPEIVRVDCVETRERDPEFGEHPYSYTTLIHLTEILNKQWPIFQPRLPPDVISDKPMLLRELKRLNSIRNRVMHL